jgi:hypothetical protein
MTRTVRRLCLTVALALTTAASGQNAKPSFSIMISGPSEVKAGSASYVDIVVENVSNRRITFGWDGLGARHAQSSFDIDIRNFAGKIPAYTPDYRKQPRNMRPMYTDLKPGEKLKFRLDLHEVFELTPGKYTLQLSHHENDFAMSGPEKPEDANVPGHKEVPWNEPSPNSNLKVDSNTITIAVTP